MAETTFSDIVKENKNKEYMFNTLKEIKKISNDSLTYLDGMNEIKKLMNRLKKEHYTFEHEMDGFLNEIKGGYEIAKDYKPSIISFEKSVKEFRKYMIEKYELEEFKNKNNDKKIKKEEKKMLKEEFDNLISYVRDNQSNYDNIKIYFKDLYSKLEKKHDLEKPDFELLDNSNNTEFNVKKAIVDFLKKNNDKFNLNLFSQINTQKPKEVEITKTDLLYLEDKEENKEMNEILKVFHQIAKPHFDSSKEAKEFSEKETGIINALYKGLGKEKFLELKIKWNPYIGLFIESKDGFDKANQKLIMSHTDLVHPFQKSHDEVKKGLKESALTIGSDGLIRGSLDNTLTNAIVLTNFIKGRFENDVSILLDRGEESGMWGATNFHKEKKQDDWYDLKLNGNSIEFIKTEAPKIKKDLVVINTDVTMGYDTSYAFETKNFSKETDNKIKEMFPDGSIARYGYDDSASTTNKENITMSYCIVVGTSKKELGNDKYNFSGGCHSENTMTTIDNIVSYSKIFEPFVKAYNNEIKLELKQQEIKQHNYHSSLDPETISYLEAYKEANGNFTDEEINQEKKQFCDDLLENVLERFDKNIMNESSKKYFKNNDKTFNEFFESLTEFCENLSPIDLEETNSLEEISNLLFEHMTDIELAQGLYEYYGEDITYDAENIEDDDSFIESLIENHINNILTTKFNKKELDVFDKLDLSTTEFVDLYTELKKDLKSISLYDVSSKNTLGDLINYINEQMSAKELETISEKWNVVENKSQEHITEIIELLGEELCDMLFQALDKNNKTFDSKNFDEFMTLSISASESIKIALDLKKHIKNITSDDVLNINSFNELIEIMANKITKSEFSNIETTYIPSRDIEF